MGGYLLFWILICYFYANDLRFTYMLRFLKNYPFFIMGVLYNSSEFMRKKITDSDILIFISYIMYGLTFNKQLPLNLLYSGVFAIIILLNLAIKYENKIPNIISFVGQKSLEIYVFHWFFLPSIGNIGHYILTIPNYNVNENFILYLIITIPISIIIIIICILIGTIIKSNCYLNLIYQGQTSKPQL